MFRTLIQRTQNLQHLWAAYNRRQHLTLAKKINIKLAVGHKELIFKKDI